jgi:hypothetical protein
MQLALESPVVMTPDVVGDGTVVVVVAGGGGDVVVVVLAGGGGDVVVVVVAGGGTVVVGDGTVVVVTVAFTERVAGSVVAEPAEFVKTARNSLLLWDTVATKE